MYKFFNCRYPIVAVAMNSVSNLNLALACYDAGIIPSISFYNYYNDNLQISDYNLLKFEEDVRIFVEQTNSRELIISMSANHLFDINVQNLIKKYDLRYIELIQDVNPNTFDTIKKIKNNLNLKLIIKCMYSTPLMRCDAVILKGPLGAGRSVPDGESITDMVISLRKSHPNLTIIASGGIANKFDIETLLSAGADLVGIGSLFAASLESPVSSETKNKIINSTYKDLTRIGRFKQQGLFFGPIDEADNMNHSAGLNIGIQNPTAGGHVYLGKAVDEIEEVLSVKDIVKKLMVG